MDAHKKQPAGQSKYDLVKVRNVTLLQKQNFRLQI